MNLRRAIPLILTIVLVGVIVFTPGVGNLWSLTTGRGFIIPSESSIFTFQVTEENHGSGEWWLHAEDPNYFYARGEKDGLLYIAFPKSMVSKCPSFEPRDWKTWCAEFQRLHESI
jgi:hypothetical protein